MATLISLCGVALYWCGVAVGGSSCPTAIVFPAESADSNDGDERG
jgi:hypothetical protein